MYCPCPQYVRSANFVNNVNTPLLIKLTFESKETEQYTLQAEAGSRLDVEKSINHGSFETCDAIEHVHVRSEQLGEEVKLELKAESIEHHEYVIG